MKKEILGLRQQITMVNMDKTHATSQLTTTQNKIKQLTDECSKYKNAAPMEVKKEEHIKWVTTLLIKLLHYIKSSCHSCVLND